MVVLQKMMVKNGIGYRTGDYMQTIYFHNNLKYLTSNTVITQSELSRILGVSRQAVHNLINNKADCRLSTIIKIADAYKMNESDLLFVDLEQKYKNKKIAYKITINNDKDEDEDA